MGGMSAVLDKLPSQMTRGAAAPVEADARCGALAIMIP